jgi:hypothetical protein
MTLTEPFHLRVFGFGGGWCRRGAWFAGAVELGSDQGSFQDRLSTASGSTTEVEGVPVVLEPRDTSVSIVE